MTTFIQFAQKLEPLHKEAANDLLSHLKTKKIEKGHFLLRSGDICRKIIFIDEGLVKTCFYKEDKELIMRFFAENSMLSVLDSYIQQKPSKFTILALEPTTITYINRADLEALCKKHHCIETFFRKLLSMATVKMMSRISEMLEEKATERYHNFVNENNHLLQRISLGDLANYLGITQVQLSRIRAKK